MKKRILSILLTLAMLLPMFTAFTLLTGAASDAEKSKTTSASSKETIYQNGIYYNIEKSVVYTGNNAYRMDIDIYSTLSAVDAAVRRTSAENGYLTVEQDGYYLIELWGGRGSEGGNTKNMLGQDALFGGVGGQSGYVYAKVKLTKGQTLVWSIGTNGASTEVTDYAAGGANGDGGDHGSTGTKKVGGGGGYSALFLFDEGEFNPAWVTASGPLNIPETARVSRYIMIAGGGGGGGAANSLIYDHAKNSLGQDINADGGAGGNINRGVSLTLSNAAVPGYVFSGRNGLSTGNMTNYVGRGGTNRPGAIVSTQGGDFSATPGPNDWSGTWNLDVAPGAGGSGNLRGGGGGAGYCGGSGGIMSAWLIASQIGGGGGGSSFLAQTVNGEAVQFGTSLDSDSNALLLGIGGRPSSVGGAMSYTFLGEEDGSVIDTTFLSQVDVTGSFSEYFDVTQMKVNDSSTAGEYSNTTGEFSVSDASILPSTLTQDGHVLHLQFTLRPKSGFAGGNNVPLLEGVKASFTNNKGESEEIAASVKPSTDFVNVALSLILTTNSIMSNDPTVSYALTELYEAEHPQFSGGSNTSWQYAFIDSISAHAVYEGKDGASGSALSGSVTPTETTYYSVVLTATPKGIGTYAAVGPKNTEAQDFYGIACVAIVTGDILELGEYTVTANKYLTHDGSAYLFTEELIQTTTGSVDTANAATYTYAANGANPTAYTVPTDGYYLIQAWGARGGSGGTVTAAASTLLSSTVRTQTGSGGSYGDGGYIYGYVYLKAGDNLSMTLGDSGKNVDIHYENCTYSNGTYSVIKDGSDAYDGNSGGSGGAYASVSLNGSYLMIAGGGGGGGGGAARATGTGLSTSTAPGGSGTDANSTPSTTLSSTMNTYSGGSGGSGTGRSIWGGDCSGGGGGSAGANYVNSTYYNVTKDNSENTAVMLNTLIKTLLAEGTVSKPSYNTGSTGYNSGSAVQITPICMDETVGQLYEMQDTSTTGAFSRYFDVENVEMMVDGYTYTDKTVTDNGNGSVTVAYIKSGVTQYSYTYTLTENADGTTQYDVTDVAYSPTFEVNVSDTSQYTATMAFSIVFTLNPKEGFLGGNDVPLLMEGSGGSSCITVTHHGVTGTLTTAPAVDYANVAVTYDLISDLTANDQTIALGESVQRDDLWDLAMVWPTGDDAWKADFVTLSTPANETLSPTETTPYTLTCAILPTVTTPAKALVVGATNGKTASIVATVYVTYTVTYTLTNMTYSGDSTVLSKTAFTATLSPAQGYNMPTAITVKIGGAQSAAFSFNSTSGVLTIDAANVTGPIEIIAAGVEVEYTLTYVWELDGATQTYSENYTAGATIDYDRWYNNFTAPEKTGYVFSWSWDTDTGLPPDAMPAHNLMVTGTYTKARFTLTVNYVNSAGTQIAPSHTSQVEWEADYSVLSPVVEGYMASSAVDGNGNAVDPFTVSGTMGLSDVTVTVTYLSSQNQVVILYVDQNGNTLAEHETLTLAVGDSYSVSSPAVTGYTPDKATVSGSMESETSITVVVTYAPNKYTVTLHYQYAAGTYPGNSSFDTSGATMDGLSSITVVYDNIYGYNAATDEYGLPTPVVAGYTFSGWYTESGFVNLVTESTVVKITADTVLYAKWEPTPYTLTIMYSFVYASGDFTPDLSKLPEGAAQRGDDYYVQYSYVMDEVYGITLPTITGYTAYADFDITKTPILSVEGSMPAENTVVYVTYEINTYTIRFMDRGVTEGIGDVTWPGYTSADQTGFDTVWQTVKVKHGVTPVFTAATPVHSTEAYTFTFNGWKDPYGNTAISAATESVDYYAQYTAAENIALVINASGAIIGYHTTMTSAINQVNTFSGATSVANAVTLQLRRNSDVAQVITVSATLNISNSSTLYLYFDLHGVRLSITPTSTNGAVTCAEYVCLVDSVGGGELYTEAEGNCTAWYQSACTFYAGAFNNTDEVRPAKLTAKSTGGNAMGLNASTSCYIYGGEFNAVSDSGTAKGIYVSGSSTYIYLYGGTATGASDSGIAYGVHRYRSSNSSTYYVYIYGTVSATSDSNTAYGVYTNTSMYVYGDADISATTGSGTAYGLYNVSYYIQFNTAGAHVSAYATDGTAYGVYTTKSLTISSTNADDPTTITASSVNGNAYGVYSTTLGSAFCANVSVTAPNGTATGVYSSTTSSYIYGNSTEGLDYTIRAEGKIAIALQATRGSLYIQLIAVGIDSATAFKQIATGSTLTIGAKSVLEATATAENGIAVGADLIYSTSLYGTVNVTCANGTAIGMTTNGNSYAVTLYANASVSATTEGGNAYAFKNGYLTANSTSIAATVTATATTGNAYCFMDTTMSSYSTAIVTTATATTGNAYGFASTGSSSYSFSSYATVTVSSDSGNAYGVHAAAGTIGASGKVNVSTESGTAYGAYTVGGRINLVGTATVTADNAYGAYVESGTLALTSSSAKLAVSNPAEVADEPEASAEGDGTEGEGSTEEPTPEPPSTEGVLYGIYVAEGGTLINTVKTTVTVTATKGNAYGIYNLGTVNSLGAAVTVSAPYLTYGVSNAGGAVKTTASTFTVTATSALSTAYAMHASGGSIGAEGYDGSIQYGVITGVTEAEGQNAYGFFADGGTIYIRGSDLYYKGSVDGNQRFGSVVICAGYEEQKAADQETYPDYYVLVVIEYTMIFIERDLEGNEVTRTELAYNTEMTAITEPAFTASYEGHTLHWSEYDFVAPTEGKSKEILSYHTVNQYVITFQLNGGTGTTSKTYYYNEAIVLPAAPTYYGYHFVNWYSDEALTAVQVFGNMPATDFTVYAAWEIGTFTITIVSNGGPAMDPITGEFGTAVETPADPVRTGYIFQGWYANEALTTAYTFSTIPGEDITVYMKWQIGTFTITVNSGSGPAISAITGEYNSAAAAPSIPAYYGYSFAGWYADSTFTTPYEFTTIPAENITVYVKWQVGTFTITFSSNGSILSTVTDVYGTAVTAPATPSKTGYLFVGWYADSSFNTPYTVTTIPGENITVYAKWDLVKYTAILDGACKAYTVKFYRNQTSSDSTLISTITTSASSYQEITVPTPTRSGYVFCGWFTSRTMSAATAADLHGGLGEFGTDTINLYAGWRSLTYATTIDSLTTVKGTYYPINVWQYDGNSSNYGYYYMTYPVTADGQYSINLMNYESSLTSASSYRNKTVILSVYHADGTTTQLSSFSNNQMPYVTTLSDSNYYVYTRNLQKGDTIVLRVSQASGCNDTRDYDTDIYAYVSEIPSEASEPLNNGASYTYTVESAPISLPMDTVADQAGWSWKVDDVMSSTVITELNASLIGTAPAWSDPSNPQVLYLYAVEGKDGWTLYVESGRHFKAFDTTLSTVTIRADRAVAMLFGAESAPVTGSVATLQFQTGLPVGTMLTLVDLSGAAPVFYAYTVTTANMTSLPLTSFALMGTSDQFFGGCSQRMLISVSYTNTENTAESETVTLSVNGEMIGASCTYTFVDDVDSPESNSNIDFPYNQSLSSSIYLSSLNGYGYESGDRVALVIKMLDENRNTLVRPAGFTLSVGGKSCYYYPTYTLVDLGTVADWSSTSLPLAVDFTPFRYMSYHGFVVMELLVLPDFADLASGCYQSDLATEHFHFEQELTLIDTPTVTVSMDSDTFVAGDLLTMYVALGEDTAADAKIEMFIYQLTENGLAYTDDCATLIEESLGITITDEGQVTASNGGDIWINNGAVQTILPTDAAAGTYFVVIHCEDKFDVLPIHVFPAA